MSSSFASKGDWDLFALTPSRMLMFGGFAVISGCFVAAALGGLVAAIACIMLLHRLVWPLASRLLYALGRYRLVQNKVALNAAGVMLAGIAITGSYGWQAIAKHFGIA